MTKYDFRNWSLGRFLASSENYDLATLLPPLTREVAPSRILLWRLPKDLSGMTFGQRWSLIEAFESGDIFFSTFAQLVTGPRWWRKMPRWVLLLQPMHKVYPFVHFVIKDLESRAKRDEVLNIPLTPEQEKAGIGEMRHGVFGLVDTIVKRTPGLYTYEGVDDIPDNRVFMMLKVDVDNIIASRNLHQILTAKQ